MLSVKIDSIRYVIIISALLCCTVAAKAQEKVTSSKIVVSNSYNEVNDKLKFDGEDGATHVLPKSNLDAKIVVDKSKNQISIDLVGQKAITQSLEQDVVVINIDGVAILTKNIVETSHKTNSQSATTTVENRELTVKEEVTKPATTTRAVEMAASVNFGMLFYDEPITMTSIALRSTVRVKSAFRIGFALSTDIYKIISDSYLYGDRSALCMLSTAFAFDLSLWDRDKPSGLPSRLTANIGYGFGLSTDETKGFTFNPGLMWYIAGAEGRSKMCMTLNYKFQSIGSGYYASGMMLGLGYKF